MDVTHLLRELVVLLTASLPLVFFCRRFGVPTLTGFLLAGIAIGPSAFALIRSVEVVETLAEIGVVLLLFTIGLEFSLRRLVNLGGQFLGSGLTQLFLTAVVAFAVARAFGFPNGTSAVLAMAVALSSTAVAMTWLETRSEILAPHGQRALSILLFQDLAVLPIMLGVSFMGRADGGSWSGAVVQMTISVLAVVAVVLLALRVLPPLFDRLLKLGSRELFVGTVTVVCFGTAWLTAELGLSLAIGAFLAGLVVSESDYSQQAVADVLPLRDLFSSVFFVAMGMLLDVGFVVDHLATVVGLVVAVVALKVLTGAVAVLPFHASTRVALLVGIAIAQIGEFSFVVTEQARTAGLLSSDLFQTLLAVSVGTMLVSPIAGNVIAVVTRSKELPDPTATGAEGSLEVQHGHVVIVGYGDHGRRLADVLAGAGVPFGIVDFDAASITHAKDANLQAVYGDATRASILEYTGTKSAAALVVTLADRAAGRRIVALASKMNPAAAIVIRTRYAADIDELYALGATEVIPEKLETSVDLFARVLECLNVPPNVVSAQVDVVRSEHYAMLRGNVGGKKYLDRIYDMFAAATTVTHSIREGSVAIGQSLASLDLRGATGATLLALVRDGVPTVQPTDDFVVARGDVFVIVGSHAQIATARRLLEPPVESPEAERV